MCQIAKSAETQYPERNPIKYYSKIENNLLTESMV
jgi:hypothetical protein